MSILSLNDGGIWFLEYDLEPVEFWPYTTFVMDVVMTGPRNQFAALNEELIRRFKDAGIKAYAENKCAFGMKDRRGSMWYLGFKDFRFDLGMSVKSDHQEPLRKTGPLLELEALKLPEHPGGVLEARIEGHNFVFRVSTETGFHSGRPRYRVDCSTCGLNLHPATTGPKERAQHHLKYKD